MLTAAVRAIKQWLYRGPVRRAVRQTGLERMLRRVYDRLMVLLGDERRTATVGSWEADFYVVTPTEHFRFDDFIHERLVLKRFLEDLQDGDIVFDVGANVGTYACFALRRGSSGTVFAFEPHPENARRLRENLNLNGPDGWEALEVALADHDGETTLHLSGDEIGEGGHSLDASGRNEQARTVDVARAATLISSGEVPQPDVVKIDVEGAELLVLNGFDDRLDDVRVVYVEVHEERGVSADTVAAVLESSGLAPKPIAERDGVTFLRAVADE